MYLFLFAQIPTYLHYILDVNIKSSGVLTSLPYLANFGTSIIFGQLCDYCNNNEILTLKQARLISNTIANVFPAICLASLSFTSNTVLGVTFLVLALATHAGTHTGWMLNYIDLAPNFSGALMATGNTLMNINALLLPVFVSRVVTDVRDPYQWRIVMFSVAAFGVFCNMVYACFMSTDLQLWNDAEYHAAAQEEEATEIGEKSKDNPKNNLF
ncbi:putative inorganic phosphate cotransporter [Hyposmocoma kahamanoa]|uniref:putative inorganic phosphate cotransporter n=1 Tax=Hyposmocoma kahamanoa TaxID=1477025 RepID=UPI000E6D7BB4|nr:putative inorganic phosphate cotransporter [Hyposmocoma kahamanoa]